MLGRTYARQLAALGGWVARNRQRVRPRPAGLSFRQAVTPADRDTVYRIRAHAYGRKGYVDPRETRSLRDSFDASSCTVSHLAWHDGKAVGTLRTVVDADPAGLPMDKEGLGRALAPLRCQGRRAAEVCKLAMLESCQSRRIRILFGLMRMVFIHVRTKDVDDVVVAVVPDHARYYSRVMLFEQISDVLSYDTLGCRAVVMRMDLRTAKRRYAGRRVAGIDLYDHFFGSAGELAVDTGHGL